MMNPWINYHHLYYFKTIAEEGSVVRAAEKLRLGQPTLSAQLKQFEESLGVQLFERQHKRLVLTEHGRVALGYAQNIFRMGNELYEVLNDTLPSRRVVVSIGALDSIPKQIILQMVQQALKDIPCQIALVEGKPDELIRELVSHRVDLVLTNFLPNGPEARGLHHRLIAKKNVAIYGAPKFKSLRKGFPQSVSQQPIILPTHDSRLRYDLDHWSKINQIYFDTIVESQDIAVKKLLAVHGVGLIPTATHTVTHQVLSGELVEIGLLRGLHEELFLVAGNRRIENPIAQHLMKRFQI